MIKKSYRNTVAYLIAAIAVFTAFALGCGGGGGDGGRQTLPGENPFGPYIPTSTGTGTGTATSTNTNTGTSTGSVIAAANLNNGNSSMINGNTTAAIQAYSAVISNGSASHEQKQEAYSGKGWATGKQSSTANTTVLADFENAIYEAGQAGTTANPVILRESKLGYALTIIQCYIAFGTTDLNTAITILSEDYPDPDGLLKHENDWYGTVVRKEYEAQNVYVSAPAARAMLALAYDLVGNKDKADQNINAALVAGSNDENVQKAYNTLQMLRGTN